MMQIAPLSERLTLLAAILALGGLGSVTLATTPLGELRSGWSDGTYQRGYETRFESHLPTNTAAAETWAALRLGLFGEAAEGAVVGDDGWLFSAEEFALAPDPVDFKNELTLVRDELDRSGTVLLPLLVPDKARIAQDKLPRGRSIGFTERYDRALANISASGLPAVDLRPYLSRLEQPFLRTDTHWSPSGAAAAADAVADAVRGLDLVLSPAHVTHVAGEPAVLEGDLLAFADTGRWQWLVGPDPEKIATFETSVEAGVGLFGDAPLDVVLVGTSFSARADFHFEGFLSHRLQADLLNLAEVGQGPFIPMERALRAIQDLESPPRLVLWEIPERYLSLPPSD